MIVPLNLPKAPLKLSRKGDKLYVWCEVRKKKLLCTPEEWVRQHIIHYLHGTFSFPFALMSTEFRLQYNGREKRADLLVFSREMTPHVLVECKAPDVRIDQEVLFQLSQYQRQIQAPVILMSNGLTHVYGLIENEGEPVYTSDPPF